MNFEYTTERLELKASKEDMAKMILDFYLEGKEAFEPYEATKDETFYTENYQALIAKSELSGFLSGAYIRYYFFEKNKPDQIIGTVSFSHITRGVYNSCIIGYKLLPRFQKKGYAIEAIASLITVLFENEKINRIEAFTLSDNYDSISLLTRLGFDFEGVARKVIFINGKYTDHNRYALVNPRNF